MEEIGKQRKKGLTNQRIQLGYSWLNGMNEQRWIGVDWIDKNREKSLGRGRIRGGGGDLEIGGLLNKQGGSCLGFLVGKEMLFCSLIQFHFLNWIVNLLLWCFASFLCFSQPLLFSLLWCCRYFPHFPTPIFNCKNKVFHYFLKNINYCIISNNK